MSSAGSTVDSSAMDHHHHQGRSHSEDSQESRSSGRASSQTGAGSSLPIRIDTSARKDDFDEEYDRLTTSKQMYENATWRMFNSIISHRRSYPTVKIPFAPVQPLSLAASQLHLIHSFDTSDHSPQLCVPYWTPMERQVESSMDGEIFDLEL